MTISPEEYSRRYMNVRQAIVEDLDAQNWAELVRFAEEDKGMTLIYLDANANPSAVLLPFSRFSELTAKEAESEKPR